jgi:hypothetical protein
MAPLNAGSGENAISNFMILVGVLHLKFLYELAVQIIRNFKFTALGERFHETCHSGAPRSGEPGIQ